MLRPATSLLSTLLLAFATAACSTAPPGGVYSRRDVQRAWDVQEATVTDITEAAIEGRAGPIGHVGGGAVGWALGRNIGHGGGRVVAGAVGAVAGAVAGEAIEKSARCEKAWQIVVELEKGGSMAVVQPADQSFSTGERVRVYTRRDGSARVAKI